MTLMTMVQALNSALKLELKFDKKVIILGEDVGKDGGVFRVTDNLWKEFGDNRVIDTPLSEAAIVGTAIGLAINGFKPVAEIQFDGFIYPGFDQLICHAARFRNRTRGRMTCPLVLRAPYSAGIRALEHHSESMEAIYAHTPGLKVVIPATPYDAKGLLAASIQDPDPVIFLEPKRVYRAIKEEVPDSRYTIPLGKANIIQSGENVTLISWGSMLHVAKQAAQQVADSCSVEVIDLRTIKPMDTETILASVKKTGRCVIVQEAPMSGGLASEIIARINEKALSSLQAPVIRVTGFDTVVPLGKLEDFYLPNSQRVVDAIVKVMSF
ncbi:MAG TPA: alpha-ketoacid dehydrogenase subunit beta [Candidatus Nanoarchaeia archaeon]|nr:alpha-ketoacid dehydrogenase subunit beta [Candidatus Nanoarchaeia archaeon]